ncbi:MAG: hypothetical protein LBI01_00545 [Elusimicrobium sp.]|jgi:hypothetical protein|nr:hypothetical protein [Elusimicrobium sp.]
MEINYIHKSLAGGRWETLTLAEQMGNIGSEVSRAQIFFAKKDKEKCFNAVARGLELVDLTIAHAQKQKRSGVLKELTRARELICDYFLGANEYNTDIKSFQLYFDQFALSAAIKKGK